MSESQNKLGVHNELRDNGYVSEKISEEYRSYIQTMEHELQQLYALSESARERGIDPSLKTECIVAKDIADLVEGLVGPNGVAIRIRELCARLQREEID